MTNIEFLVNELRKATETIAELRKSNAELRSESKRWKQRADELAIQVDRYNLKHHCQDISLGDLDALAALRKKMEES